MTTSLWRWRVFMAGQPSAFNAAKLTALAEVWANNESGQSVADERLAFANGRRLALTASPEVQFAVGINTLAKDAMRAAFLAFNAAQGLNANEFRFYAVTAYPQIVASSNLEQGVLVASNSPNIIVDFAGNPTIFSIADALTDAGLVLMAEEEVVQMTTEAGEGLVTEANEPLEVE